MTADYLSIHDLERLTGEPRHILNHAILRHGPEPRGRVGISRLWAADDLPAIRAALELTAARSTVRRPAIDA